MAAVMMVVVVMMMGMWMTAAAAAPATVMQSVMVKGQRTSPLSHTHRARFMALFPNTIPASTAPPLTRGYRLQFCPSALFLVELLPPSPCCEIRNLEFAV